MPWASSTRRQRLPANWATEIVPAVMTRDGHRCRIRWDEGCEIEATEVDHKQRGDDHRMVNLQAACSWCHGKKSSAEGHAARKYLSTRRRPERHPGLK